MAHQVSFSVRAFRAAHCVVGGVGGRAQVRGRVTVECSPFITLLLRAEIDLPKISATPALDRIICVWRCSERSMSTCLLCNIQKHYCLYHAHGWHLCC